MRSAHPSPHPVDRITNTYEHITFPYPSDAVGKYRNQLMKQQNSFALLMVVHGMHEFKC